MARARTKAASAYWEGFTAFREHAKAGTLDTARNPYCIGVAELALVRAWGQGWHEATQDAMWKAQRKEQRQ